MGHDRDTVPAEQDVVAAELELAAGSERPRSTSKQPITTGQWTQRERRLAKDLVAIGNSLGPGETVTF